MEVVIPAHNEADVIERCLGAFTGNSGVTRVHVVANACTDRTAAVARTVDGPVPIRVVETERPGKAGALNLGDAGCHSFPRAYLDADIELSGADLDSLGRALVEGPAMLAVPAVRVADAGTSWTVRRYLRVWRQLPAVTGGAAGRGVYVLSAAGHGRVFPIPEDLLADDGYVDRTIGATATVHVPAVTVVVQGPRNARVLLRRRLRVLAGNRQLVRRGLAAGGPPAGPGQVLDLLRAGRVDVLDCVVFLGLTALARAGAAITSRRARAATSWSTAR